jgi:hypothetical protein
MSDETKSLMLTGRGELARVDGATNTLVVRGLAEAATIRNPSNVLPAVRYLFDLRLQKKYAKYRELLQILLSVREMKRQQIEQAVRQDLEQEVRLLLARWNEQPQWITDEMTVEDAARALDASIGRFQALRASIGKFQDSIRYGSWPTRPPMHLPQTLTDDQLDAAITQAMHEDILVKRVLVLPFLSLDTRRCMVQLGITTLGDLTSCSADVLLATEYCGVWCLDEVFEKLHLCGLRF